MVTFVHIYVHILQVLSSFVADAFEYFGDPETTKTEHFVCQFDCLFDCLNVRSSTEWCKKRKDSLKPYTSTTDSGLEVSYTSCCLHFFCGHAHGLLPTLSVAGD